MRSALSVNSWVIHSHVARPTIRRDNRSKIAVRLEPGLGGLNGGIGGLKQ